MLQVIHPGLIDGKVHATPSKSLMQRYCAAALLHHGKTIIHNAGKSEDDFAALEIIKKLGAKVQISNDGTLTIIGNPDLNLSEGKAEGFIELDCNESGLSLRMFTAIAALCKNKFLLKGRGSLLKRPVDFFDSVFPQFGVQVSTKNGFLPVEIQGPLMTKNITINGALSSQFLTGLLFAFSHKTTQKICIEVKDLKSKPYIDLTLEVLQKFGYDVENENYCRFFINPVFEKESDVECIVEGDWSSASFLLVAGAIAGKVELSGLSVYSKQADRSIITALSMAEANMSVSENLIKTEKPFGNRKLKPFHFDATDCPDLFPPLAVLAANCDGISVIEGVGRLLHKESNRASSLISTFASLGIRIELQDDLMIVYGGSPIKGGEIHSFNDHRIAMAGSVLGIVALQPVKLSDAQVVAKSYPEFFNDLESIIKKQV